MEKIILKNFNSFQNDEVDLSNGFTIITGPNGAGKSTIFQGIKFGLTSNERDGRSKKWSDFIRIGQEAGSVELHISIEDDEKKEVYKIRRTIQFNKAPVFQIKEPQDQKFRNTNVSYIQKLVNDFGYNPDNVFSFVSQGNITSIKNMESKEICNFLEVGLGLQKLKDDIFNEKKEINSLESQINSLDSIKDSASYELELISPKLKRLEEKKKLEEKRDLLEKEKAFLNISKLENEIIELNKEMEDTNNKIDDAETKKKDLIDKIEEIEEKIKLSENEINKITEEILKNKVNSNDLKKKIKDWEEGKDDLANQILRLRNETKTYNEEIKRNEKDLKFIKEEVDKYSFELSVLNTQREKILKQFNEHKEIRKKHQKILDRYDEIKKDGENLQLEVKKKNLDIENTENQIENQMDEINRLRKELNKFTWFKDNPKQFTMEKLKEKQEKIDKALLLFEGKISKLETERIGYEKEIEKLKNAALMKEMPKTKEMNNLLEDIKERQLNVIGPLFDVIEFNPKIGPAIHAVLGKYVLNSFIARNKNDFLLMLNLAKKNHTIGNIYKPLDKPIRPNYKIEFSKESGIYGYLVDLIKPNSDHDIVTKLIYSICRNSILVKDESIGYEFMKDSDFRGKIVTLDGTILRKHDYVLESRVTESKSKFTNPSDQKRRLLEIKEKLRENLENKEVLEEKKKQIIKGQAQNQNRIRNINTCLYNYKKLTITINKKNLLLDSKKELIDQKNLLTEQIIDISSTLTTLKRELPNNFDEINAFFDEFEERFSEIEEKSLKIGKILTDKERGYANQEMTIIKLKNDFKEKSDKLITLEDNLKSRSSEILKMVSEVDILDDIIEKLKINKEELIDEVNIHKESIKEDENNLNLCQDILIRLNVNIENLFAQIYEKERILTEIKKEFDDLDTNFEFRNIQEVENDLKLVYQKLRAYYDVSDEILIRKNHLEQKIGRILEKKEHLKLEVNEAINTEKRLEGEFFKKFKEKLILIENNVNKRFKSVGINRKGKLLLTGPLEELKVEINVIFDLNEETERKLSTLSGGEQTMFAISLMLTLQELNPSPMCIFDEAQMFLDQENSHEVSKLIKDATCRGIQFVIIVPDASKTVMQLADKIIGIAKNGSDDVSTVIEIPII